MSRKDRWTFVAVALIAGLVGGLCGSLLLQGATPDAEASTYRSEYFYVAGNGTGQFIIVNTEGVVWRVIAGKVNKIGTAK